MEAVTFERRIRIANETSDTNKNLFFFNYFDR